MLVEIRRNTLNAEGGLAERIDARRPSNKAPIGTKLCQNAFQAIPVNSIFVFFCNIFLAFGILFLLFGLVLEALQANRPQIQYPRNFLFWPKIELMGIV